METLMTIEPKSAEYERAISEYLKKCMIKETHNGYKYLRYAFKILKADPTAACNIKKCVYMPIEEYFNTAEESAERCIKYAIRSGFKLSRKYKLQNIFSEFNCSPSNKVFIEKSTQIISERYFE